MLSITLFVDDDASSGGDGLAWATAYDDLQSALTQAAAFNADTDSTNDVDQIWIAEGTYYPSAKLEYSDTRSAAFSLLDDITLYGGFTGTETTLSDRDAAANVTVLSGDLGIADNHSDNAYTVVYCDKNIAAALDGIFITDGNANGSGDSSHPERSHGGGICNLGNLTIANSTISANSTNLYGGGIYNYSSNYTASLTIINSIITENSGNSGGGIYNCSELTITNSTLTKNSVIESGGGLDNYRGHVIISNSTISDNSAYEEYGSGGGIHNNDYLTITNSTISGNSSHARGGGIYNRYELFITNSTFSGNSTTYDGGGIFNVNQLTVTNSTFTNNSATGNYGCGGGICFNSTDAEVTINNTVVANNTANYGGPDLNQYNGTLSGSNNFIGDGTYQPLHDGIDGNIVGISGNPLDPMLTPLQDNGGPTLTHTPLPGSPLINAGNDALASIQEESLIKDQRGFLRKWGAVDIGAVEDQPLGIPMAYDDIFALNQGESLLLESSDILSNDFCSNESVLTVEILSNPQHGTLITNPDGTITYTPEETFWGTDSFSYRAHNSQDMLDSDVSEVVLSVISPQSIIVTVAEDEQDGNLLPDDISLREAVDYLNARQIQFSISLFDQDVHLNEEELVTSNVQIVGLGVDHLTINGDGIEDTMFLVRNGSSAISHVTITGCVGDGENTAISVMDNTTLLLDHVAVRDNQCRGITNRGNVTIANSTISDNSSNYQGGGIYNYQGTMDVFNSTIEGNSATMAGGGIFNDQGVLTITDTTISSNSAVNCSDNNGGGGIYNMDGTLTITSSTITSNSVDHSSYNAGGGGLYNRNYQDKATLTISNSTISENTANGTNSDDGDGGGIYNQGTLTIVDSTLSGNSTGSNGGGIYNSNQLTITGSTISNNSTGSSSGNEGGGIYNAGLLTLTNSTLSGNSAHDGSGIYIINGTQTLTNVTIFGNSAQFGGGIYTRSTYGTATILNNSVVAGNTALAGADIYYTAGLMSGYNNLIGNEANQPFVNGVDGNLVGTSEDPIDPMLGPLQDNGGSTLTHVPLSGSPLIDAGNDEAALDTMGWSILTDQRDYLRKYGSSVDIGAAEFQPEGVPVTYADAFQMNQGSSVTFENTDFLANDVANDGSVLTAEILTDPQHGTLVTNPDGTITYTPAETFWGTDSFSYRALNGSLESNATEVILSVISPQSVVVTVAEDERDWINTPDDISLREAMGVLHASQIQFSTDLLDQTLSVDIGILGIASDIQIVGLGTQHLAIDGGDVESVFHVASGNSSISHLTVTSHLSGISAPQGIFMEEDASLLLDHMQISNNRSTGVYNEDGTLTITNSKISGNQGNGIYNRGTLNISNSTISNNEGGIFNAGGELNISDSTISNNSARVGGGINLQPWGSIRSDVTISNSIISNNSASESGGGIYSNEISMTITNSTISNNVANDGGGISIFTEYLSSGDTLSLNLRNTTLANNVAKYDGGGLMVDAEPCYAMVTVTNSTFSENSASRGGGLYNNTSVIKAITNSTFFGNSASDVGGGMYCYFSEVTLNNTVIAGNTAPSDGPDIYNPYGDVYGSHNLIGDGNDQNLINEVDGNRVGTSASPIDPMLGSLQNNGGPTLTHAPLPGSPLIDMGSNILAVTLTDQRGFLRQVGTVDIGAVEYQPAGVPVAYGDAFELDQSGSVSFETSDLLANDICNDRSLLTAVILSEPQHGTMVTNPDGTMTYTPEETFWGTDSFTYRALNDSLESNVAEVIFSVVSPQSVLVTTAEDEQDGNLSDDDISIREAIVNLEATQIQFSTKLFDQPIDLASLAISDVHIVGLGANHLIIDGGGESGISSTGNSIISDLTITGYSKGPGIFVASEATLLIDRAEISHNTGGGIICMGTLTVTDSIISGNSSNMTFLNGGGIYNIGVLSVINSTITNNSTTGGGGGIYTYSNSDIDQLTITNCTITGNTASRGGGIYNGGGSSPITVTISNSIVANNSASVDGQDVYLHSGTLSGANNLIGNGSNQDLANGVDGNQIGTSDSPLDPMLDDNGMPLMGSPVIDAGSNALIPSGITTDVAGNARIFNGTVDIGAYESDASSYFPGDANRDGRVDGSDVTILAAHWQAGVLNGDTENVTWNMGDFNGDGKVDGSDVTILAGNWQRGVNVAVVATSDSKPEPEPTRSFTPPANASLGVATVPRRTSIPQRRLLAPSLEATNTVLRESSWNETDMTAIAKDLVSSSTQKRTLVSDEFFKLEIDLYGDL